MKKKNFTLLFSLLSFAFASAQSFDWAGKFGGDGEDVVLSLCTDAEDNIYTTGFFTMDCDFDISEEGEYILTADIASKSYIQKTAPDGTFLWAKAFGGDTGGNGTKITTDADGNVYVTGVFSETGDFDPGEGELMLTSAGNLDIYIAKFTEDGDLVWAKNFEGAEYEETNGIGLDNEGNIYVSGYFYTPVDFDPSEEEFMMTSAGAGDGFIVKLTNDGRFIWAKRFGGTEFDLATGLKVMPDGDTYITGNFRGTADLDPSGAVFNLSVAEGSDGIFVLHLDKDGAMVNAAKAGEAVNSIFVGPPAIDSTGAIYISGYFGGQAHFTTVAGDIFMDVTNFYNAFVAKLSPDGFPVWARPLQSDMLSLSYAVALNSYDEPVVMGYFNGTLTLDEVTLTEANASDSECFIAKLNTNGLFAWAKQFGGINVIDRCALVIDSQDNICITSAFDGTVDINPEAGAQQMVSVTDFRDNFLIKMSDSQLSLPAYNSPQNFTVYPNPAKDVVVISAAETLNGTAYTIYDMAGRRVLHGSFTAAQQISISSLQSGLYNLTVGTMSHKLVVE